MKSVYFLAKSGFAVLFLLALFAVPVFGQFSLVATQPGDGAVNVASPATFQLTFSSAIDTSMHFSDADGLFLNLEMFPEDTLSEPDISLSPDLTTVTFSGVQLFAGTQYTVLLSGARSATGEALDHPYVLTFTTGASLPSGTVSGNLTLDGSPAGNAVVALFPDLESDAPIAAAVSIAGSYTVEYVPDGTYYPYSVKDSNGDGSVDPSSGDAGGIYDPNGDRQPDSIQVVGGAAVTGIDITLSEPAPVTASSLLPDVQNQALAWSADAVLVEVNSYDVAETGKAFGWSFIYYSPGLQNYREFRSDGGLLMQNDLVDEPVPGTTPLPDTWVDSDVAAPIAEGDGGSTFRATYPDASVDVHLHYFTYMMEGNAASKDRQNRLSKTLRSPKNPNASHLQNVLENGPAVWDFDYWSESEQTFLRVTVNAETGALLASDAMSNFGAAQQAAAAWAGDASLIQIENRDNVRPDGRCEVWGYVFQSASLDSTVSFQVAGGHVVGSEGLTFGMWPFDPLNDQMCNSTDALALAQAESETFRNTHTEIYVNALLSRNIGSDPAKALWRIAYNAPPNDYFEVLIDAESCNLYTGVSSTPAVPEEFALQQNYPNPFNPTTEVTYTLPRPGRVTLTIFNLRGQKIRILVDAVQVSGLHKISWDGHDDLGRQVPSGLYLYRLKAGDLTQSRKMLLVR